MIGQSPGHHGDDRAAAGRRRGPRRGQEADGGEDVADRGDPVCGVLAPLPHILHPRILRAKYVDTHNTKSSIFCFNHFCLKRNRNIEIDISLRDPTWARR